VSYYLGAKVSGEKTMPATMTGKKHARPAGFQRGMKCRTGKNGYVHVASPATVKQFSKTYRVDKTKLKQILGTLRSAGIDV
jgi:hypothetical protein